jgi:head-tail adaptor
MAVSSAHFISLLNVTATIQRKTRTSDGAGGWSEAYQTIGTEPARIRPASDQETTLAAQREAILTHVAYFALGVDVARDDRVLYVAPNSEVLTLTVRGVREPSQPHHLQVDCEEVQHGQSEP